MDIATLRKLIAANDATALRQAFVREHNSRYNPIDFLNYDTHTHRIITDRIFRRDKIIYYDVPGQQDISGEPAKAMKVVPVTRLAIPFQKEIVDTAVSFSVGGQITLNATPKQPIEQTLYDGVKNIWLHNKMKFRVKDIARKMFSQTECAAIIYTVKDPDEPSGICVKNRIVAPADGDTLYPIFDGTHTMIAFGIEYLTQDYRFAFDVYTDTVLLRYRDLGQGLQLQQNVSLPYGKIPVVYFNQDESEWRKVQHLIERYEVTLSNLCDTNDYNGSPILFTSGEIEGFADKGETGKVIQGLNGADMKYLSWDSAPESIKLELEKIENEIRTKTRTIDLSPTAIKGMGSAPSGVAFDRMLIGPHMKGQDKQDGSLGEGLQRLINIFQSIYINVIDISTATARSLYIEPNIDLFRIDDIDERVTTMQKAMPGVTFVSMKTAVGYIGMVNQVEDEVALIETEAAVANPVPPPPPKPVA